MFLNFIIICVICHQKPEDAGHFEWQPQTIYYQNKALSGIEADISKIVQVFWTYKFWKIVKLQINIGKTPPPPLMTRGGKKDQKPLDAIESMNH